MILCISPSCSWPKPFSARPWRSFFLVSGTLHRERGYALAIVRIGTRLCLVDQVANGERMVLSGTEDQRLFPLVDLFHEQFYAVRLALFDLDNPVEVGFLIEFPALNFALHDLVIRRIDVLVERGGDLLYAERRQEAIVDALLERIDIQRIAEVSVGVRILLSLWRRSQAELNRGSKVFQDSAPVALVIGPAAVALVDNDEVEEIRRIVPEVRRRLSVLRRTAHKRLENRKEDAGILRNLALLANLLRFDPGQSVLGKGGARGEVVVGLVGQGVAVCKKEDARSASGFASTLPVVQVPTSAEELPGDLECNRGFTGACGQCQKHAVSTIGNGLQNAADRSLLVETERPCATLVRVGNRGKAVTPRIHLGVRHRPQLIRRGILRRLAFLAGRHVDAVDALAVGGIGVADCHLSGVVLGLRHPFGQRLIPGLSLNDSQLGVAILQNVICLQRIATPPLAFNAARSNHVLAPNAATLDLTPARRLQRGINVLGSRLGFVHRQCLKLSSEGLVQKRLLQRL